MDEEINKSHWIPDGEDVLLPKQKQYIRVMEGERGGSQLKADTRPLDIYAAKWQITNRQYRAGKRLNILWVKGNGSGYVQSQYREGDGGGKAMSFFPLGMEAQEYREALYAIDCPKQRAIVHAVCCEDIPASKVLPSSSRRTAERTGMKSLRAALDALVRLFGYDK